jgi:serine protease Do
MKKLISSGTIVALLVGALVYTLPPRERYIDTVNKVMPTVVEINVIGIMHQVLDLGFLKIENDVRVHILGSGTFINSSGYILTCAHLFSGFKKIEVVTVERSNGDVTKADIVNVGKRVDLALIKTTYYKITPYASLADPRSLQVGQEVIAIGSPLGLSFSVSNGIISALYRDVAHAYNVTQSNTSINPGNSGGPLFNLKGELVGVNSFMLSTSDVGAVFTGLGFSVQCGEASKFIIKSLKEEKIRNQIAKLKKELTDLVK